MIVSPATFLFNSQDRASGSIQDASFLTPPVVKARKVQLSNFCVANTAFAVQTGANVLIAEAGPAVAVVLPAGSPDLVAFAAQVQTALNAAGLAGVFTVTANVQTLRLTITSTVPFTISWPSVNSASYALGWGAPRFAVGTGAALTHTSPFACAGLLNATKIGLLVSFSSFSAIPVWASSNINASFVVDVSSPYGSMYAYRPLLDSENLVMFPQGADFQRVRVQLVDPATGLPYDTQGADYQIGFTFYC